MRIVVVADSLALPRGAEEGQPPLLWEETWPSVLQQRLQTRGIPAEVINCGERARTIESLVSGDFDEHVILKQPDVVVFQVGIVDCAPRIISRFEKRLLNLPGFPAAVRKWFIQRKSARRQRLTEKNPLQKVYVKPKVFLECLHKLEARISALPQPPRIVWLPIIAARQAMEAKSPGFVRNLDQYNEIVKTFVAHTNWHLASLNVPAECFDKDGYHLNRDASAQVASEVDRLCLGGL